MVTGLLENWSSNLAVHPQIFCCLEPLTAHIQVSVVRKERTLSGGYRRH